ncbi:MAG: hypothetical protein WCZ90_19080 [Melioribacteraceae bacterium]
MNYDKAWDQVSKWLQQIPSPKELNPTLVFNVLESLGFISKGKVSDHTKYRYYHKYLEKDKTYFPFGIVSLSLGHKDGGKTVMRQGSVNMLLKALRIFIEAKDEERS